MCTGLDHSLTYTVAHLLRSLGYRILLHILLEPNTLSGVEPQVTVSASTYIQYVLDFHTLIDIFLFRSHFQRENTPFLKR